MLRGVVCGAQQGKQLAQLLAAMVALATHYCLTAPGSGHGRHSPVWQDNTNIKHSALQI